MDYIEPCNPNCKFCFLNYVDALENNYLFRNISPKEIGIIIRDIHHQVKSFKKGNLIASEGDSYNNLMIIVKGSIVAEMIDFEGRVLRVEQLYAPNTIATAFIFGYKRTLPVSITATEDTKLLLIPRDDLLELFRKNGQVLNNYLDIMANRTQFLSKQLKILGLHTIKGKIAHYLLEIVKNQGRLEFVLSHSQNELAEQFGVARPSIGRVMRELHEEGIIYAKGKNVKIIDKKALSGLLK